GPVAHQRPDPRIGRGPQGVKDMQVGSWNQTCPWRIRLHSSTQMFSVHAWLVMFADTCGQSGGRAQHVPTGVALVHSFCENCIRLHSAWGGHLVALTPPHSTVAKHWPSNAID